MTMPLQRPTHPIHLSTYPPIHSLSDGASHVIPERKCVAHGTIMGRGSQVQKKGKKQKEWGKD